MTISVKVRRHISYTIQHGDREFEVEHQPLDWCEPIIRELPDGRTVLGYISHDDDCSNPFDDCDGMGNIFDRRSRHASRESKAAFYDAMGCDEYGETIPGKKCNPYAVLLDVYDHSGEAWSIQGEGMNDRWDTTRGAGVWIPDHACIEHIEYEAMRNLLPNGTYVAYEHRGGHINVITYTLPDGRKKGGYKNFAAAIRAASRALGIKIDPCAFQKETRKIVVECARQACETFNEWLSGACYGVCVEVFDANGGHTVEPYAVWGFIGMDYAQKELEGEVGAVE